MPAPELFDPDNMPAPVAAYSHCARAIAGSETIYLSGQVGVRADGAIPATIGAQAAEVYANIMRALEANQMSIANLAKVNTYVVQGQSLAEVRNARAAAFGDAKPASTLVYVSQLVDPNWLIEVEAVLVR